MKSLVFVATAFAAIFSAYSPIGPTPAEAAHCRYKGITLEGRALDWVQGNGYALKKGNACDRARRECNRVLDRNYRKGNLPRGVVCKKTA
ncbi:MAG TPA: hypothetical protein PK970_13945 [Hyphomicrobiaceae bacterium]|nr:hypothetical protein [Hyphomicrobiaceae bacterium]